MPIHDWTRVDAGLFHDFHQSWSVTLRNALNSGVLPGEYFALVEQRIPDLIPDVLTLRLDPHPDELSNGDGGTDAEVYAEKANRITVRHRHGNVVAVIEIVSPGNKNSHADFREFVEKSASFIVSGIHVLVIDLFPLGKRDPQGTAKAIWDEIQEQDWTHPADQPLVAASFAAGAERVAYVEPLAVGDLLPEMPLFLKPEIYVPAPLEATYQTTWSVIPKALKRLLEP